MEIVLGKVLEDLHKRITEVQRETTEQGELLSRIETKVDYQNGTSRELRVQLAEFGVQIRALPCADQSSQLAGLLEWKRGMESCLTEQVQFKSKVKQVLIGAIAGGAVTLGVTILLERLVI